MFGALCCANNKKPRRKKLKFKSLKLYEENGQRVSRMIEQTLEDLAPGDIVIQSQYAA